MRAEDYTNWALQNGALQKGPELYELIREVMRLKPRNVLEIGVCHGGTFRVWQDIVASNHRDGCVVGIDLPGGAFGGGPSDVERQIILSRNDVHTRLILKDSHFTETQSEAMAYFDGPIDFLMIDGDHTYEGVKSDYELYSRRVRDGGLIALHDICVHPPESGCSVEEFWEEHTATFDNYDTTFICEPTNWGGLGLIRK